MTCLFSSSDFNIGPPSLGREACVRAPAHRLVSREWPGKGQLVPLPPSLPQSPPQWVRPSLSLLDWSALTICLKDAAPSFQLSLTQAEQLPPLMALSAPATLPIMPQAHAANHYFAIIIIDNKSTHHILLEIEQIYKCLEYILYNI